MFGHRCEVPSSMSKVRCQESSDLPGHRAKATWHICRNPIYLALCREWWPREHNGGTAPHTGDHPSGVSEHPHYALLSGSVLQTGLNATKGRGLLLGFPILPARIQHKRVNGGNLQCFYTASNFSMPHVRVDPGGC